MNTRITLTGIALLGEFKKIKRKHVVTELTGLSTTDSRVYPMGVGQLPVSEWPRESLRDLLAIAVGTRRIDSSGHPVLKRLRGEA